MSIIAIDPGPQQSAVVDYDPHRKRVLESRIEDNEAVLKWLRQPPVFKPSTLVIEWVGYYGKAVGKDVFETIFWAGRFAEAWGPGWHLLPRPDIKLHLCDSRAAKDKNIRQALLDKFGGEKFACAAPIRLSNRQHGALRQFAARGISAPKINPLTLRTLKIRGFTDGSVITDAGRDALDGKCGPLYGMATHKWSALAAAVTWAETHQPAGGCTLENNRDMVMTVDGFRLV